MILAGDYLRGHTDAIILNILRVSDSYGYEINQEIKNLTNSRFVLTEATLYTAFKRLENVGYISSYWVNGIKNVKRKYYTINQTGLDYLKRHLEQYLLDKEILEVILERE